MYVSELPIFTTRAHVFHIDPDTKKKWLALSSEAVSVSYYHDSARHLYRIISVDGTKVVVIINFNQPGGVVASPTFLTGGTRPPLPHSFGLKFVQKLVHCCNWLLSETQCKIISVQQQQRPFNGL